MNSGSSDGSEWARTDHEFAQERMKGRLNTPLIIIFVMAMVAPISGFAGPMSLGIGLGNGAGMPGAMLISTLIMLCFAAGYAAMSQRVKETGAFYAYATKGLGRPAGGVAAFIAFLNYNMAYIGMAGGLGYFSWALVTGLGGPGIPWWGYSLIATAIIFFLGRRNIDISAKVLVVLLAVEMALLIVFIVAAIAKSDPGAFTLSVFSPGAIMSNGANGLSIGIMYCFFLFGGVELAAVYAEETKNPEKTVGRGTYGAVLAIGIFYMIAMWAVIAVVGAANVQAVALNDMGQFAFNSVGAVLGQGVQTLISILVITSLLAAMVGIHQAVARYSVAMSRDHLMPKKLAHVHPIHKAPQNASLLAIIIAVILILLFAVSSSDPFTTIFASLTAMTILGTLILWVMVCVAFVVYFRRHSDKRYLSTFILPIIATIALSVILVLLFKNYTLVTGSEIGWINNMPLILIPIAAIGIGRMLYLRKNRPEVYANIWAEDVDTKNHTDGN